MTISVVITTFNHGPLVADAIRSALQQTLPPHEIVVIDDGSTDGTSERLQEFRDAIRYIWQANSGIASARNRGVAEATGHIVALMDGDDLWHAQKLEITAEAFRRYPASGLVAVGVRRFNGAAGRPDLTTSLPAPVISSASRLEDLLDENFLITTSQVAIPRGLLRAAGPSEARHPLCSEFPLYCRIAQEHPVTTVDSTVTFWRIHASSASGHESRRELRWGPEMVAIVKELRDSARSPHRELFHSAFKKRRRRVAWIAMDHAIREDRSFGLTTLTGLLRKYPTDLRLWAYFAAALLPSPLARLVLAKRLTPQRVE